MIKKKRKKERNWLLVIPFLVYEVLNFSEQQSKTQKF